MTAFRVTHSWKISTWEHKEYIKPWWQAIKERDNVSYRFKIVRYVNNITKRIYDINWFYYNWIHKDTKTIYDEHGYDIDWYDKDWYDKNWFDKKWYDKKWYDKDWYGKDWFNKKWFDIGWFDRKWIHKDKKKIYDKEW